MPTLHLPSNVILVDGASTSSGDIGTITPLQIPEIVQNNSDFVPATTEACTEERDCVQVLNAETVYTCDNRQLRNKLKRCQKLLYSRNRTIRSMQRRRITGRLRRGNKWENVTQELCGVQKTFFDMVARNFNRAPHVSYPYLKRCFVY